MASQTVEATRTRDPHPRSTARGPHEDSPAVKWVMRVLVVAYLFFLVAWPTSLVAKNTFANGFQGISDALSDPDVVHALKLSAIVAVAAVLINLVFGVGMALLLVRFDFPGKRVLNALIDVPLSVSPVVVGLALVLVYNGRYGWFGPWLEDQGLQVVFAKPGMIMATAFVALPLVIREVVPVLEDMGDDQEQAARSLGANAWQTFWRITLPGIKWAIVYGVVLCLARSLGEFGAVKVVAGNVGGESTTAPMLVQQKYQNFQQETAYSVSFMLAFAAVLCLIVVALLRPKEGDKK
ncbi:sulfate ABC transporter permease [Nocardioides agariphilus]